VEGFKNRPKEKVKGNEKERSRKPELLRALIAAGAIFASSPAGAETARESFPLKPTIVKTVKFEKKGVDRPVKSFENTEEENIKESIDALRTKLAPGGEYYKARRDPKLTKRTLDNIILDISGVLAKHNIFLTGQNSGNEKYAPIMPPKNLPAGIERNLHVLQGGEKPCKAARVLVDGYAVEAIPRHCVEGTREGDPDAKTKNSEKYFYEPEGLDIAVKKIIPSEEETILSIDTKLTDEDFDGQFEIVDTTDLNGTVVRFSTFLLLATPQEFQYLAGSARGQDPILHRYHAAEGFWYVAPPGQGEPLTNKNVWGDEKIRTQYNEYTKKVETMHKFQGQSGTSVLAQIPKRDNAYFYAGGLSAGAERCMFPTYQKTCVTLEYATTPKALETIVRKYRSLPD